MKLTNDKKLQQSQFKNQIKQSQQHLKSASNAHTKLNEASPIKVEDLNELIGNQKRYIESINQLGQLDFQNMNEQGVIPYPIYLLLPNYQYNSSSIRYKNQIEELTSQMQKLKSQLQLQEERELQGQKKYQAEILQLNEKHNLKIKERKLRINLMIAERQNLLQQINITGSSQIVQKQQKGVLQTAVEKLWLKKQICKNSQRQMRRILKKKSKYFNKTKRTIIKKILCRKFNSYNLS